MKAQNFIEILGADFYTGVPDSQLKELCNYLMERYGVDPNHHVIAANEGNCVALAAGYHLATGKTPVVYMQNSGEGNAINPIASLLSEDVYAVPVIFVIGWRGEPGVHDEPQHIFQGNITLSLLEDLSISAYVIDKETQDKDVEEAMRVFGGELERGKSVAFVVRKGTFEHFSDIEYSNDYTLTREEVIRHIVSVSDEDPIVATTGKASRELFDIRSQGGQTHKYDFLTVGSMGHSSSVALGIALSKPNTKIWCIDGDGALLMHMGAMAVIGAYKPQNMIHVVINNGAHETVGGMPTVAPTMDIVAIAKACGYTNAISVSTIERLDEALFKAKKQDGLQLIEVKCSIASRKDLGRPTCTPIENKMHFMTHLSSL